MIDVDAKRREYRARLRVRYLVCVGPYPERVLSDWPDRVAEARARGLAPIGWGFTAGAVRA